MSRIFPSIAPTWYDDESDDESDESDDKSDDKGE